MNKFYEVSQIVNDINNGNIIARIKGKNKLRKIKKEVLNYIESIDCISYDDIIDTSLLLGQILQLASFLKPNDNVSKRLYETISLNELSFQMVLREYSYKEWHSITDVKTKNVYKDERKCTITVSKNDPDKIICIEVICGKTKYMTEVREKIDYHNLYSSKDIDLDKRALFGTYKNSLKELTYDKLGEVIELLSLK